MKPQIKISIAPAPLDQVLTAEFEAEQRQQLALYYAAPELLDALKSLESAIEKVSISGGEYAELSVAQGSARAAIAKAEGK